MNTLKVKDTFVTVQFEHAPCVGETFMCAGKHGLYGTWVVGLVQTMDSCTGRLVASMESHRMIQDDLSVEMETFAFTVGE